ncbi:hypothetical protein BST61_g4193 [Cercospora zeina]
MEPTALHTESTAPENESMAISDATCFRFMLVGIGPHAKRTYVKHLKALKAEGRGEIVAAVDVTSNKQLLEQYAAENLPDVELTLVPYFREFMPTTVQEQLTRVVQELKVDCVIVSTDPECHKPYALWAVELGLHVIMDKPISTRSDACNDPAQAIGIADDYMELLQAYQELQTRKTTMFLVNSHRRYHPGMLGVRRFIEDIRDKTGCPATSLISTHCDGQWRLPSEIADQHYHPFRYGYGKVSHSGYHILDTSYKFFQAGWTPNKRPDTIEIVSTFVCPNDFMYSLSHEEHGQVLGQDAYQSYTKYSAKELELLFQDMGEIDAMIQVTYKRRGNVLGVAHLNLLHTGFSRRDWIDQGPNPDLYKGCGRVKHEAHEVRCGPFQTVVIDSRQANDKHDRSAPSTTELGSDNHFEVQTWRNCGILGEKEPLKTYTVKDLDQLYDTQATGLYIENIKQGILWEALDFMQGKRGVDALTSNLPDHAIPAAMMSAAYVSHIRRSHALNPVTRIDVTYADDTPRATIRESDRRIQLETPASMPSLTSTRSVSDDEDISASTSCTDVEMPSMERTSLTKSLEQPAGDPYPQLISSPEERLC